MIRKVLRSKIHRAHVTHADLHYEGSITLAPELMELAGLVEYEAVQIWNVTNGNRFETYAMRGRVGTTDISINGAAAHLARPGDIIIIGVFQYIEEMELIKFKPRLVFVDENNRPLPERGEIPGPSMGPAMGAARRRAFSAGSM